MNKQMLQIRNDHLAREAASGKEPVVLAEEFGLSKSQVHSVLRKDRSREIIEEETKKLLSLVPEITEQVREDLQISKSLQTFLKNPSLAPEVALSSFEDNKDILEFLKLSYKKQQDVMKAVGIFPSNSTNVFIQQIYNDNRKQVLSPEIFKALGGFFTDLSAADNEAEEAEVLNTNKLEELDENN